MTAGVVIAREAGARVVDSSGIDHNFDSTATIASNAELFSELLPIIRGVLTEYGELEVVGCSFVAADGSRLLVVASDGHHLYDVRV